jgi:predicted AAA+ superfamily ATPase
MLRAQVDILLRRLLEPRRFLQILAGPRQVGKTTIARDALAACGRPQLYASADGPSPPDAGWIDRLWDAATLAAREAPEGGVLVLDEVQKVPRWSEAVKARWDDDTLHGRPLRVVLLGSAPLLVQQGLTESLAGRFELVRVPHWSFAEVRDAFGWDLDRYVLFGGYPGAAPLVDEPSRWAAYVRDALVETTLSRDVLLMSRVDKPALLRRLFDLACAYSGRELSYTKMLGQLQDAGNTTTLAHYLTLLAGAGLVAGLQKYAGDVARRRGSSPKLCVLNAALVTSRAGVTPERLRADPEAWGRLVESCVGAHLLNTAPAEGVDVAWWRAGDAEVDFVLHAGRRVTAVEVKSGFSASPRGLIAFRSHFPHARALVVGAGSGAIPLGDFLARPAADWLA